MADAASAPLHAGQILRREPRPTDVVIKIHYCGICHSDVHQWKNDWGNSTYPLVCGHEIVGQISAIGNKVERFMIGDRVGVGCMVDSCGDCDNCQHHNEQMCFSGATSTYGAPDRFSGGVTYGGYSEHIVVDERFVLRIPDALGMAEAAPLLCAGITTYSPLKEYKIGPESRVGIVGLGGLGHVALLIARAMGAYVVAFTSKQAKVEELKQLGANEVVLTDDEQELSAMALSLHLIIDTVADEHDVTPYLLALTFRGTYHFLGASPKPVQLPMPLILIKHLHLAGNAIGGIQPTQEMLEFCAKHSIKPKIELGQLQDINKLYERLEKGDVRYRFVLDVKSSFAPQN